MPLISARPALVLAYFTYFGVLGIFVPYFGLFLDGRGLNSADIGLLLAIDTAEIKAKIRYRFTTTPNRF